MDDPNESGEGLPEPVPPAEEGPVPQPEAGAALTADDRTWGMLAHLSALSGVIVPLGNIIGPLVVWLVKREQSAYVDYHGKEALNFNISFLVYGLVAGLLILIVIGLILLPLVVVAWLVLAIVGAVRANAGEQYRYPLTFRFVQ